MALFNGKNLLNPEEVAEILKISVSTVRTWVFDRKIPFVKFGGGKRGLVKFDPEKLNQWIEEKSIQTQSKDERLEKFGKLVNSKELRQASNRTINDFNNFLSNIKP